MPDMKRLNRLDALLTHLIDRPGFAVEAEVNPPSGPGGQVVVRVVGFDMDSVSRGGECGTAACALGWAGVERGFRSEGLQLCQVSAEAFGYITYAHSMENSFSLIVVAEEFFGIPTAAARDLFLPADGYSTAEHVRDRLRGYFLTSPAGVEPPIQF